MYRLLLFLSCVCPLAGLLQGRDFTVLVYNVENLFDVDGVALFDDYRPASEGGRYGVEQLLNKLEGIRRTLEAAQPESGPDVVVFQEFELDRTPWGTPDTRDLLSSSGGQSLAQLLQADPRMRSLPAELLLLKYLDDHGMGDYHIAQADPARMESHPPHKNVVFSRFPVTHVRQWEKYEARQLLEVWLDIEGSPFIILNNHWKSGASNPEVEPIRVQNARVVRARVDALLLENPAADILVAGDLNAYYNHRAAFPDLPETAVNCVLRSTGSEISMLQSGVMDLYNLWFEVPPMERGSEVWRGRWGTLMQMLISSGLYDRQGIQYVDNSFGRLVIPGFNVDSRWQRPRSWTNRGGGNGVSDHLPVYARFRVVADPAEGWLELANPGNEALSAERPHVDYAKLDKTAVPSIRFYESMDERERAGQLGEVFEIDQRIVATDPVKIRLGEQTYTVFSPVPAVRSVLERMLPGDVLRAYADADEWRGEPQFVIRDASWMIRPAVQR